MRENSFIKKMYLHIENSDFCFVTNEIHDIEVNDIEITFEDHETYFKLQSQGKQFKLKEVPTGNGLFDYVEEYEPIVAEMLPYEPTLEDRISELEKIVAELQSKIR